MILSDRIEIQLTNRNRNFYKIIGYDITKEKILIKVSDLPTQSNYIISVKCDICSNINDIAYYNYNRCLKNGGIYTCFSCKTIKTEQTNIIKYGCSSPTQNEFVKEKTKKTNLSKYGCSCTLRNPDILIKSKKTSIDKYGSEYPSSSPIIRDKVKKSFNIRYGVDNVFMSDEFKNKQRKIKSKNGCIISEEYYTDWNLYKNNVRRLTNKNKKYLIENWNGLDYYDNEYILENFNLHHNDVNYPTIDHKISTFYGFNNNIPYEELGSIVNLVMTKRKINSYKNNRIYDGKFRA